MLPQAFYFRISATDPLVWLECLEAFPPPPPFCFITSTRNYVPLSDSALFNPGFLFSECAHMVFILNGQIHQGSCTALGDFLQKNLIMPLRKCTLKIRGCGCAAPSPAPGTAERLHCPCSCLEHSRPSPPSRQDSEGSPCQNLHFRAFPRDIPFARPRTACC